MNSEDLIEEAIAALGRGDDVEALLAISGAVPTDTKIAAIIDAVHHAASELAHDERISEATWNGLADSLLGTDLEGMVDSVR